MEVKFLQQRHMAHGALHQGLRGDAAVLIPQLLLQGAAIDADADGDMSRTAGLHHRLHPLLRADVAGVDTDFVHPLAGTLQGQPVVEMDIRHQGDMDAAFDGADGLRRRHIRHSHPDDLTAGGLQGVDLIHRSGHIVGLGVAHGLDGHRCTAPNWDVPHHDLSCHRNTSFKVSFPLSASYKYRSQTSVPACRRFGAVCPPG